MKIVKCLVSDIEKIYHKSKMSTDVRSSYQGYVEQHAIMLSEHCPSKDHLNNEIHHLYLLIDEDKDIIVGFRYFYFPTAGKYCELFAIFVDSEYRKKGFALDMIEESIKYSNSHGKFDFIVRIASSKSAEQAGLLISYVNLCARICPPNKFTIYSCEGKKQYGL